MTKVSSLNKLFIHKLCSSPIAIVTESAVEYGAKKDDDSGTPVKLNPSTPPIDGDEDDDDDAGRDEKHGVGGEDGCAGKLSEFSS